MKLKQQDSLMASDQMTLRETVEGPLEQIGSKVTYYHSKRPFQIKLFRMPTDFYTDSTELKRVTPGICKRTLVSAPGLGRTAYHPRIFAKASHL
jgi:hypothetical protein